MSQPIINQALVDRIVARARASDYGLGDGLKHKQGQLDLKSYTLRSDHDLEALALLLVNAYHEKYDLVSVFFAAMQELTDQSHAKK